MVDQKEREWPRVKREKIGDFLHPRGYQRSERAVAGPLRLGTAPGVGPAGLLQDGSQSDFGMDFVNPKRTDPIGTGRPLTETAGLLSRQIRGRDKPDEK
jgi:hypothetical protein